MIAYELRCTQCREIFPEDEADGEHCPHCHSTSLFEREMHQAIDAEMANAKAYADMFDCFLLKLSGAV